MYLDRVAPFTDGSGNTECTLAIHKYLSYKSSGTYLARSYNEAHVLQQQNSNAIFAGTAQPSVLGSRTQFCGVSKLVLWPPQCGETQVRSICFEAPADSVGVIAPLGRQT